MSPTPSFYLSLTYLQSLLCRLDAEIAAARGEPQRPFGELHLQELRDARDCTVNLIARARIYGGAL